MTSNFRLVLFLLGVILHLHPFNASFSQDYRRIDKPNRVSAIGRINRGAAKGMRYQVRLSSARCKAPGDPNQLEITIRKKMITLLRRQKRIFISQLYKWMFVPESSALAIAGLTNSSTCYESDRGTLSFASIFKESYPYENPHQFVKTFVLSGPTKNPAGLKDFFEASVVTAALYHMSERTRAYLRTELLEGTHESGVVSWINRGTLPVESSFSKFVATQRGLKIFFEEYQVAPYAMGIMDVDISWDELAPFLARPLLRNGPRINF
jgi:hypothetical protein